MDHWILTLTIFSPLLGAAAVFTTPEDRSSSARRIAWASSLITLALTLVVMWRYAATTSGGDYGLSAEWSWFAAGPEASSIDIKYSVGIDGISAWLLLLTAFLTPLAIWASFSSIHERVREYYALMLILHMGMLGVFCARDLLLFYVFFEFTLIPLYFIIGIWGGPARRQAANKFFIFTLAGSVLTFAGVLYAAYYTYRATGAFTLDIQKLVELGQAGRIPFELQWWLFLAFAAGFAIKVPLFPVHTWLPLAHTEAPTAGSVILAGVLLKLGTYGFCRISLAMLPEAAAALAPTFATLAIIGIVYGALAAWVQNDVKKLVAYSSVSHLGFCMLGLFSLKMAGVSGAVLYMINHGLSTGALFLIVGMIYERYHTRDIHAIGGLARPMPWMAFFLVFFTLSSIGLPGLNGFVSEFLVLLGTATSDTTTDRLAIGPLGYAYAVPAAIGIILGAVYMLWMCQRVLFGPLLEPPHTPDTSHGLSRDLTRREIAILTPIALVCIFIGVYPRPLLDSMNASIRQNVLASRDIEQPAQAGSGTRSASPSVAAALAFRPEGARSLPGPSGPGQALPLPFCPEGRRVFPVHSSVRPPGVSGESVDQEASQ